MFNPKSSQFQISFSIIFIAAFLIWIIFSAFFGEKLPIDNGIAGDAITYFNIVSHFQKLILPHQLPVYDIQRLLPLFCVYVISKIAGISSNNAHNVILLFSIYNTFLICIAIRMWWLIGEKLAWDFEAKFFAFCALFLNFCVLKSYGYEPVATDPSAFVAGLLIYYFFIAGKKWCLLLTTLFSAFIYPMVIMLMGLCLLFPNPTQSDLNEKMQGKTSFIFYLAIFTLAVLYFILGVTAHFYTYFHPIITSIKSSGITSTKITLILHAFEKILFDPKNYLPICIILISTVALFFYFLFLLRYFYKPCLSLFHKPSMLLKTGGLFVIIIIIHHCFFLYSNGQSMGPNFGVSLPTFILNVAQDATLFPLVFLVAHIIYFGPIICFCIFLWKDILKYAWYKNTGLFLLIGFYVFFCTNGESRQFTNFFPLLVVIITDILNKKNISFSQTLIFGFTCFITSKVWLQLNHGIWPTQLTLENIRHFPMQWVFMNIGTWLTPLTYNIDAAIALISMFFIFILFFKKQHEK